MAANKRNLFSIGDDLEEYMYVEAGLSSDFQYVEDSSSDEEASESDVEDVRVVDELRRVILAEHVENKNNNDDDGSSTTTSQQQDDDSVGSNNVDQDLPNFKVLSDCTCKESFCLAPFVNEIDDMRMYAKSLERSEFDAMLLGKISVMIDKRPMTVQDKHHKGRERKKSRIHYMHESELL